jgi:hypothetical protein
MGTFGAFLTFVLARKKKIPLLFAVSCLLSSAFFIFYSRMYMYEIHVVWTVLFLCLGVVLTFEKAYHLGFGVIFLGAWAGTMTKLSFNGILLCLPVLLFLEWENLFPLVGFRLKKSISSKGWKLLFFRLWRGVGLAGFGASLTFALVVIVGAFARWQKFRNWVSRPASEAFGFLNLVRIETTFWETLWIDIGPGIFVGLVACLIFLAWRKRFFAVLGFVAAFVILYVISTKFPRWVWPRYLVGFYPLLLFSLFSGLAKIDSLKIKNAIMALVMLLQLVPFVRTTWPLMTDVYMVHWTEHETFQHIPGFCDRETTCFNDNNYVLKEW